MNWRENRGSFFTGAIPDARLSCHSHVIDVTTLADMVKVPTELLSYLEGATEPYVVIDRNYGVLAANTAYRERYPACETLSGRRCHEVSHHHSTPCDQAGESCPLAMSLASGARERVVHLHRTPTGQTYENIEITPIRNDIGEIVAFVERLEPLTIAQASTNSGDLVGRSPRFTKVLELVSRVAKTDTTVLIEGATGTGKELVARAIHDSSPRHGSPFVVVECSGIPESLFESELFGHEKGAFTGASALKRGLIETAGGGTLFLDEVGDIPLAMQVKLLRFIETGTFRRVGGVEIRRADTRIVSATNVVLRDKVATQSFRADLYYRLNAFQINLPTLAERTEDLPLLIEALLRRIARARTLRVSRSALEVILAYGCPGNIRELRNILEHSSVMCTGEVIDVGHLPDYVHRHQTSIAAAEPTAAQRKPAGTLKAREHEELARRLDDYRGPRRELAATLGISERTLYRKLRRLKGDRPPPGDSGH